MAGRPPSHELVQECIFTALMLLMEKKEYDKITITEITEKAGVSRMSYYRIYHSKDDILSLHLTEVFDNMIQQVQENPLTDESEFFRYFFCCIEQNHTFFKNILKAGLLELLLKEVKEKTITFFLSYFPLQKTDQFTHYKVCFFVGGFMHIAREWLQTGMPDDVETMVSLCSSMTQRIRQTHLS